MAFGLQLAKKKKDFIFETVGRTAKALGLDHMLERKPSALSGGKRQRVALGRAIVRSPKVFLFDEPLSNLDAKMRVQMRSEISKLHAQLGNTMIYVTLQRGAPAPVPQGSPARKPLLHRRHPRHPPGNSFAIQLETDAFVGLGLNRGLRAPTRFNS